MRKLKYSIKGDDMKGNEKKLIDAVFALVLTVFFVSFLILK